MGQQVSHIFEDLKSVQGLKPITLLNEQQKNWIRQNEDRNNLGVLASLQRKHTLLLIHDSSFREPTQSIVQSKKGRIIFPAVSFPEVKANKVASSSPSKKIHHALLSDLNLKTEVEEATLLIGFDI